MTILISIEYMKKKNNHEDILYRKLFHLEERF